MSKKLDVNKFIGLKFNKLLILGKNLKISEEKKLTFVDCLCDCGRQKTVLIHAVRNGNTKSCGCSKKLSNVSHGLTKDKLFKIWVGMKHRCDDKNDKNYGGRGIKVCKEWRDDYGKFRDWALNNGYNENLRLARIDTKKNYKPNNCKFSSFKEINNNKRSGIFLKYNGEIKSLKQWCEELNLKYITTYRKIKVKKVPIQEVFSK